MSTRRPDAFPGGDNVDVWKKCPNCKARYEGLVELECAAAMWRKCHETDDFLAIPVAVLQIAPLLREDTAHAVRIVSDAVRFFKEAPNFDMIASEALSALAECLHYDGQYTQAISIYRELLRTLTSGPDAVTRRLCYVECLTGRGSEADLEEAERECRRALSDARQLADATLISQAQGALASALTRDLDDPKQLREGLALFEEVVAENRRVMGRDHFSTLESQAHIVITLIKLRRTADADALYQDMFRRAYPHNHWIIKAMEMLGEIVDGPMPWDTSAEA